LFKSKQIGSLESLFEAVNQHFHRQNEASKLSTLGISNPLGLHFHNPKCPSKPKNRPTLQILFWNINNLAWSDPKQKQENNAFEIFILMA